MSKKTTTSMILWFFLALFFVSLLLLGRLLWPFVSIIIMAAVVSGIFTPLYFKLQFKGKVKPWLASLAVCLLIFFVIFIPVVLFVGILSKEAYDLYVTAKDSLFAGQVREIIAGSDTIEKINAVLANFNVQITGDEFNQGLSEVGKSVGLFLYNQARAIASNMFAFLINFFLMLLIVFFLLIDGWRLLNFIVDLSPLPDDQDQRLIQKFKEMTGAVLIGNGFGGLVQGIIGGVVFAAFGLNSPFLWGVIMGLLAFLPIVGVGLVFIPTAALVAIKGNIFSGALIFGIYLVLSMGVEYLLKPKLVGDRSRMHTLLVFLAMIGGLKVFGILGIIYGPLIVTGFLTMAEIYRASYREMVDPEEEKVGAAG